MFGWLRKLFPPRSQGPGEITEWELNFIRETEGHCPDCVIGLLVPSPTSVDSMYLECESCGSSFSCVMGGEKVATAQRLGERS